MKGIISILGFVCLFHRAQAKKIFSVVIEDPIFDKAMQKYLSPSTIRNIQRTLDTLRKTKMY
jgi:hypothetical protein